MTNVTSLLAFLGDTEYRRKNLNTPTRSPRPGSKCKPPPVPPGSAPSTTPSNTLQTSVGKPPSPRPGNPTPTMAAGLCPSSRRKCRASPTIGLSPHKNNLNTRMMKRPSVNHRPNPTNLPTRRHTAHGPPNNHPPRPSHGNTTTPADAPSTPPPPVCGSVRGWLARSAVHTA